MKNLFLLLLLFSVCLGALKAQFCTNDNRFSNVPFFTDAQITSQLNVAYASVINGSGGNEILKLDVYYPLLSVDTLPLRPFILMVHGGGLVSGDKINFTRVCQYFAKRGFVAATIDYRLGFNCNQDSIAKEKAAYRVQQDINAALRFTVQNAAALRIDTSWMFIGGGSAGSVSSLSTIYLSQAEWNAFSPSLQGLLGSLNSNGNNLTHTFSLKGIFNNWGATPKANIEADEMLPMVSFHGDADSTVAIDSAYGGGCAQNTLSYGSRTLHKILTENGVCSDLSVKIGGGHGVYEDSLGTELRVGRAACFFKSLFCNTCVSFYQTDSVAASCGVNTNIENAHILQKLKVFPNPFERNLHFQNLNGRENFLLFTQLGQVVYSGKEIESQNFSDLPKGIYFLKIEQEDAVEILKLLK